MFSDSEYGLLVSADPTFAPSTRNCTFCTPTVSDALAVTVGGAGHHRAGRRAVIETLGALLSTVIVTFAEVRVFPAVSRATALRVWVPSASQLVSPDIV